MSRSRDWTVLHGRWHDEPCEDCGGERQDTKVVTVTRGTYVLHDNEPHSEHATTHTVRMWWFADPNDLLCKQCRAEWDAEMQREAALAEQRDWERMMEQEEE